MNWKANIQYISRVFQQIILTTSLLIKKGKLRPYGQPGQMPIGNFSCLIDWVKSSNFISWLLYNQCLCTQLVKRSIRVVKVIICYIDSDQRDILNIKKRSIIPLCFFGRLVSYVHDYFVLNILTNYAFLILKLYPKASVVRGNAFITLAFLCVNN